MVGHKTIHPKERMRTLLYLSQEIVLELATPGVLARNKAGTHAVLLRDAVVSWVKECGWEPNDLLKGGKK